MCSRPAKAVRSPHPFASGLPLKHAFLGREPPGWCVPRVEVVTGEEAGRVIELGGAPPWAIGASRRCALRLRGAGVAFQHATLTREGAALLLADQRSPGGTFLNGRRLRRGEPQAVGAGDLMGFGEVTLRVLAETEPGPEAPDPDASIPAVPNPVPSPPPPLLEAARPPIEEVAEDVARARAAAAEAEVAALRAQLAAAEEEQARLADELRAVRLELLDARAALGDRAAQGEAASRLVRDVAHGPARGALP